MICFWSVVSVYKVILRLDHLLSLNCLSLQALSFSKLRSMAAVSSSRQLRNILNRTRSSSLCCATSEGHPLGVWNPQGRVSCHRWDYFAKETEWGKEHGELLFLVDVLICLREWPGFSPWGWKSRELSDRFGFWHIQFIIQTRKYLSGAGATWRRVLRPVV